MVRHVATSISHILTNLSSGSMDLATMVATCAHAAGIPLEPPETSLPAPKKKQTKPPLFSKVVAGLKDNQRQVSEYSTCSCSLTLECNICRTYCGKALLAMRPLMLQASFRTFWEKLPQDKKEVKLPFHHLHISLILACF
jgi:hypothetical protein